MKFDSYVTALKQVYVSRGRELTLHAPALAPELDALEAGLGFAIDPGLRAAWMFANGGPTWSPLFVRPGYFTGLDFLSIGQAIEHRDAMRRCAPAYVGYSDPRPRDRRLRGDWFCEGWLPFAQFGGATILLIQDYSPSASGFVGQIIAFTHDPDEMTYAAPDFEAFLQRSHDDIVAAPDEFVPDWD